MTDRPLIEVRGLKVHFPSTHTVKFWKKGVVKAVDGIDFSIDGGRTLGLVGESGCGKSTVARALLGLVEPTAGRIAFDGVDLTGLPAGRFKFHPRRMQIVFQDPYGSLNPRMRIHRMLAEPLKYYRLTPPGRVDRRVAELLDLVHLGGRYSDHYPHELSGGQRQRVCIARALALEPQVIICDEPVSALDVSIRGQILNLLKELQDRLGLTYLFISHDLSVVRHMCDRMSVMYLGRIMETGPSEALFQSPVHPYTQALLSAVPADHPAHKRRRVILEGDPPSPADPPPGCVFHTRCPRVRDACRDRPPAMSPTAGDPDHQVACHVFD